MSSAFKQQARFLKQMNTLEVEAFLKEELPLLLPIGTLEAHGRHLPISTDTLCAEKIAERISLETNAVIAPSIEYGLTNVFLQTAPASFFPPDVFKTYVEHIVRNYRKHGFKTVVIINGHGGNREALKDIIRNVTREQPMALAVINWWGLASKYIKQIYACEPAYHAAVEETAAILHFYPDLVTPKNYSPEIDDYVVDDNLWFYPPPGEVLLAHENEGRPVFDTKKAEDLINLVSREICGKLNKWLAACNRLGGGLRPNTINEESISI